MAEKVTLLMPQFVPAALLEKAWEEARKPSPMMQMIRDTYGDTEAVPDERERGS